MKNLSVRISDEQRRELNEVEDRSGMKPSEAIRHAIDMFLTQYREEGPLAVGLPDRRRAGISKAPAPALTADDVIAAEVARRTQPAKSAGKPRTAQR